MSKAKTPVVVIGGPTASGKSALALELAARFGGIVVNADSMQLYRELSVLTAWPGPDEIARAPHRLYGVLPAAERGSAVRWRALALEAIAEAGRTDRLPIVVGGTGLYLRALMQGLAEVPAIPEEIRRLGRERYVALGGEAFRDDLVARDPASAKLDANDTTRLTRAWEVLEATGRPLADWQTEAAHGSPEGLSFLICVLDPPRERLYADCDRRFGLMMERGALDEVRRLDALGLNPDLPAMKALGVPELRRFLHGEWSLEHAVDKARQTTRNYAKRQGTWFRHQLGAIPAALVKHGSHAYLSIHAASENELVVSAVERVLRERGCGGQENEHRLD